MEAEKISVIVPIYNVERYLERCVESIQKQTYQNLEIILVDDGSPDSSGEMCDSFSKTDERIKVIHKANGGLSDARNAGIEQASGEYLAFVDSDDWLDLDMLEILHTACAEYNADIAECSYRNLYADCVKEETSCSGEIVTGDAIFALEGMLDWRYFKPNAWNKIYKRCVIGDIRYPKGRIHEDEFTTYKYFYNAEKLVYVDISKYNYDRRRVDSITGEKFREANLDSCWAFRERMDFFEEHGISSLERKMNDIYCWQVLELLYKCYKNDIRGQKVNRLIEQMTQDIPYLKMHDVNPEYISKFEEIVKKGLKRYGIMREERENS